MAGFFSLIPGIRFLGILGLYSLYSLYLGLPVLVKAPEDRTLAYTVLPNHAAPVIWHGDQADEIHLKCGEWRARIPLPGEAV